MVVAVDRQDTAGAGDMDRQLDDRWRARTGDNVELVVREVFRRAIVIRDGGSPSRIVVLVDVLNHLGDLMGIDTADLWTRD